MIHKLGMRHPPSAPICFLKNALLGLGLADKDVCFHPALNVTI